MKRLIAVLTALLLLLSGCGRRLWEYPRVEPQTAAAVAPVTIGITIPFDADDAVKTAVVTMQAKLLELSGGSVTLELYQAEDVVYEMGLNTQGLYLLNAREAVALDPRLGFIQMPFLFENAHQLLAVVNAQGGEVRSSPITGDRLGGEVMGVYYGGAGWFLGKTRLYDEVGFYSSAGVLGGMQGNSCFNLLGAESVIEGSSEELFALFTEGKIKYCELWPDDELPEEALAKAKALELTNHRFSTRWMVLRDTDNTLDPRVHSMLQEAFAYTVTPQNTSREELDKAQQTKLELQREIAVNGADGYTNIRQLAKKYYRENWQTLGIPPEIWAQIQLVRGY